MNGYYGGGWMWGSWMMLIGGLVFLAIIGAVVWLVIRSQKNQHTPPLSSLPQQHYPVQRNERDSSSSAQPSPDMYQVSTPADLWLMNLFGEAFSDATR